MNKEILGKQIKQLRIERSYSQEKLSELVDISPRQMCVIENGNSFPSLETFEKIVKILQVDAGYFLNFEPKALDELRTSVLDLVKAADRKNLKLIKEIITSIGNNR